MRVWWWLLWHATFLWHVSAIIVRNGEELRAALGDNTVNRVDVAFEVLNLCEPECIGINISHSVDIVGAVPVTWKLSARAPLSVSAGATVLVSDIVLNAAGAGSDPVLSDAWIVRPGASLRFARVSLVSPVRRGSASGFQRVEKLEGSFSSSARSGGSGLVDYRNSTFIWDAAGCFEFGIPVYDHESFRRAFRGDSITDLWILQDMRFTRSDFPASGVKSGTSLVVSSGGQLRIRGCDGVLLDLNFLDRSIFFEAGASLLLEGDYNIANARPSLADDWGMANYAFIGFFSISPNASAVARNITVLGNDRNPLFDSAYVRSLGDDVRPSVQTLGPQRVLVNHNRTKAAWDAYAHSKTSFAAGYWLLDNVTIEGSRSRDICNADLFPAFSVNSGSRLLGALRDLEVTVIRIVRDIRIDLADGWPTPDVESEGINITRPVHIYSCEPVSVDTSDLYQMVYVRTGGYVKLSGPLTFLNAHSAPRRGFNTVLLGWLSVEGNGIIELEGSKVVGHEPGFTNTDNHPFRESASAELLPSEREVEVINATHSRLVNWRLTVGKWMMESRGLHTEAQGYWNFVDVLEIWQSNGDGTSSSTIAAIVGGTVGAAVLLLAAVGLLIWWRRKAQSPRDTQEREESMMPTQRPPSSFSMLKSGSGNTNRVPPGMEGSAADIIMETKRAMISHQGTDIERDSIELDHLLGHGSYGRVYKGKWRGTEVAIKTLVLPSMMTGQEKLEKMAVMETAISSSLSHPNIIQTYSFAIRPVLDSSASVLSGMAAGSIAAEASRLMELFSQGTKGVPTRECVAESNTQTQDSELARVHRWELLLILEYCDRGSLRAALNNGDFNLKGGAKDFALIARTAMGVARAMLHLHSENVIHSDLKARNVLLQSSGSDKYVAKVSDFGLSMRIDADQTHISDVYQGTMTHMAPEVLMEGKISKAADVYAYGILLWELYTAGHAFKGTPQALLGHQVTQQGVRPEFPEDCPCQYQQLARSCWDADPNARPNFRRVLDQLEEMQKELNIGGSGSPSAGMREACMASSTGNPNSQQTSDNPSTPAAIEEMVSVDATELHYGESGMAVGSSFTNPIIVRDRR